MFKLLSILIILLSISACDIKKPSGKESNSTNDSKDNNFTIIRGTVPGTLIEAICEQNKYFSTNSVHNGTNEHPFELRIESQLNCKLQMTTNEGTDESVTTNIAFEENNASGDRFKSLANNINLGNIPLALSRSEIVDENSDGIADLPIVLAITPNVDVLDVDDSGPTAKVAYPLYDINTTYLVNDRVSYNGEDFEAREWNIGHIPDYSATGSWIPLSYASNIEIYEVYDDEKQYHYPNRVRYFDVVYEARYDTLNVPPSDLDSSRWKRLGE